eukprot:TRINITY_DN24687_c0_g1_i1.p1 TRINITY_DN24687_c0_g1~~TRINITY_DN24687_c0_g1_i1.p1  ORF type:complete len:404 (+),score=75.12 TRINITY_DN24687_c0_g1_i1:40-1251(+)
MNGHHIDVSPLVGQVRHTRRTPATGGINAVDEARSRAIARATSYRSKQRSMSLPERMTPRKSPGIRTPRESITPRRSQEEGSFTPGSSTQDRVKQAMERAARRTTAKAPMSTGSEFRRSQSMPSSIGSSPSRTSSTRSSSRDPHSKRVNILRRKLYGILTELEDLEKVTSGSLTPSSRLSAGWELALKEGQRKEEYLQSLLSQSLEEIKIHRIAREKAEEELSRLRVLGKTSLDTELREELEIAGCLAPDPPEEAIAQLRGEIIRLRTDNEGLKMQVEVLQERTPTKFHTLPLKSRDGLKRLELEGRCVALEQMVKSQELSRSQHLLPHNIRTILLNNEVAAPVQEQIMNDIHDLIQERQGNGNGSALGSPSSISPTTMSPAMKERTIYSVVKPPSTSPPNST